jgi:hypothetical protein
VYTFNPENKTEDLAYNQPFFFIVNLAIGGSFGGPDVDDRSSTRFFRLYSSIPINKGLYLKKKVASTF